MLQGHGDVGSNEASGAGDEDGEVGVGAVASRASDVVLLIGAAIGTERSVRVRARRRREKEKEAERRKRKNVKNGEQLETRERKKLIE